MSLVAQAMVMTVTRALRGQTWAADRVYEQPINPLKFALSGPDNGGKPMLAVYVEHTTGAPRGLELQHGIQSMCIKIVAYVPPVVRVVEGGETLAFNNDSAALVLNLMQRQVLNHLQTGNTPWVQLFRKLSAGASERKSRFLLIEFEDGVRLPSAEMTIDLQCAPEPNIGEALKGPWLTLDGLLRGEGEGEIADLIKASVEAGGQVPDWALLQAQLNLSDEAYLASGLAPLAVGEDGEAATLIDVEIDTQIEVTPPQVP
jgi:hypothetical protein